MTYSYTTNAGYNRQLNNTYKDNGLPAAPLAATAGVLGVTGGAIGGACKKINIINKDGVANDSFIKTIYDKYAKSTSDSALKEFETQRLDIMQKLKNVSNKEDLKKLVIDNKKLMDNILAPSGQTAEGFAEGIKWYSLFGRKKQHILKGVESAYEIRLDDISNKISECWNPKAKKFEQAKCVPDELYQVIKNTKNGIKAKQILKSAGIAGLIAGAGTFVVVKIAGMIRNKTANKSQTVA